MSISNVKFSKSPS